MLGLHTIENVSDFPREIVISVLQKFSSKKKHETIYRLKFFFFCLNFALQHTSREMFTFSANLKTVYRTQVILVQKNADGY